jgi:hypothetical protein
MIAKIDTSRFTFAPEVKRDVSIAAIMKTPPTRRTLVPPNG